MLYVDKRAPAPPSKSAHESEGSWEWERTALGIEECPDHCPHVRDCCLFTCRLTTPLTSPELSLAVVWRLPDRTLLVVLTLGANGFGSASSAYIPGVEAVLVILALGANGFGSASG